MNTPNVESVRDAMQDAWNDFCSDAGNHPDCFYRQGRKLYADFTRGNFAQMVAERLAVAPVDGPGAAGGRS